MVRLCSFVENMALVDVLIIQFGQKREIASINHLSAAQKYAFFIDTCREGG